MPAHFCQSLNHPIAGFLLIKTAGVTDPAWLSIIALHFAPLIFSCRYPENFITTHPQGCLAATTGSFTVAMRINRLGKPYPVLKPESSVSQSAYRAHINHVAAEIIINCF